MTTQEPGGLAALAEAMKARMAHLDLNIADVGKRGGPQRGAMREILYARRRPRVSTLQEIDKVLGWPEGLAEDILHERCDPPAPDEWGDLPDENRLGLVRSQLLQMRKDNQRMTRALEQQGHTITELLELVDEERQGWA
ncbi:hypothetical protein BB737_16675 [Mycobacterium avium subsp. hominissuis]|uniref:Uncharacterized protein n=2 Tax=Mycobacterium TaxID=1763 RepID=A0AA37Q006_9MYCO|nr:MULTISPECIES: hypothetical protein [Mycobacterium]APA78457.1 hypothetical protein KV38_24785 [Mycobacterium avium subsp. hominissuis]PBJ39115.1 hypothetical protein XV03_03830 [Mycobacterium avium subsp. hominissuis]PBJ64713.1 hypothetical protein BB737_16675 [Mycobacterium avium subsp. hominissuis]GLB85723.1 hypothetical protein SRL2020028_49790 [Mycobacterium kiyosense]